MKIETQKVYEMIAEATKEADVLKQTIEWLKRRGFWVWRANSQGTMRWSGEGDGYLTPSSAPGCPDILGVLPDGKALMIEVKRPSWKAPKEPPGCAASKAWMHYALQKSWIDRCAKLGGVAFFCLGISDLEKHLTNYIQQKIN